MQPGMTLNSSLPGPGLHLQRAGIPGAPPNLNYSMLGIKPRASSVLGKHSANRDISSAHHLPSYSYFFKGFCEREKKYVNVNPTSCGFILFLYQVLIMLEVKYLISCLLNEGNNGLVSLVICIDERKSKSP